VIGAILVNYAKTTFTSGPLAPYWLFMLGGLFIAVTLLLPRGVVGTWQWWMQRRHSYAAAGNTAAPRAPQAAE
jgi:urea transport system permease protein